MPSKPRIKGGGAERALCEIFNNIFGGNFMRVPNSGAYVGGANANRRKNMSTTQLHLSKGDIIPADFMPRFVVESKFYKDFPWHQLLRNKEVKILEDKNEGWITQCLDACDENDVWFLCMKFNNLDWFVLFDKELIGDVKLQNYTKWTSPTLNKDYIITDLRTFFTSNADTIKLLTCQQARE